MRVIKYTVLPGGKLALLSNRIVCPAVAWFDWRLNHCHTADVGETTGSKTTITTTTNTTTTCRTTTTTF